jgi:hypothetical protein
MMKRLGWIGVLSLVCAGVSAGPVIEAQNRSNRGARSNARAAQPQSIGHSPAAAIASKGSANGREQHPDIKTQQQPSAAKLPLAGPAQSHPGVAPAQTSGILQTQSPSTNQLFEGNLHGMNSLVVSHGSGSQTQPSMAETFKTNSQNQTPPQNQTPTQKETSTQNQPSGLFSTGEKKPSPPTNTQNRKPRNGTPLRPSTTSTHNQNPWKQAPPVRPPMNGYINPPDWPRPTISPFPGQQVLPTNRNPQPEPAVSYTPSVTNQPPPPSIAAPSESQAKASSEDGTKPSPSQATPKMDSPVPQQNRDDGKIAKDRPKPAPHGGTVSSAVTKLEPSSVRPVGKKALVTASLASLAGAGFWILHMLLNVTTGCRWDVPKVTVVGPQPHVSLSFVPDVGPAEERITFLKTKRRSG